MNGTLPSARVFLSDLASLPNGSKVRFLGCVRTYNISTGHLILEHNYPQHRVGQETPCASVDINAVLETVTWEELRVGAWLNVVGYVRGADSDTTVTASPAPAAAAACNEKKRVAGHAGAPGSVSIEAVVVFSAGAIALGEYERILRDSREIDRRVQRPG